MARDWDSQLDVAMDALTGKGVYLALGTPEWMQRHDAERRGALAEYNEYRRILEGLSRAIDLESDATRPSKQLMLNI